ncbi:FecCD family ABC transporter permease [Zhenpiania hominis]|uniref:Iron ABC transporter permease n=1 Tax=Zhenpiania hominis TaxID=2763644 RepID=A0A923SRK3_9FIRM|nr:iron ABC transporter permease [Zhenpiania hominis]MBC6679394.1 iron ABC transporter permease [Zhenpiania hominis]
MTEPKKQQNPSESKIQMKITEADRNIFRDEQKRRFQMEKRKRTQVILLICLLVAFVLAVMLPNGVLANNINLSPAWYVNQTKANIEELGNWLGGDTHSWMKYIVYRYLIVALVGAALAVSGTVYQGSFRNALASPTTLGVQTGGVLGGSIYILFFMKEGPAITTYLEVHEQLQQMNLLERYAQSFFILAGCLGTVALIVSLSKLAGRGKLSSLALILCGSVFSSVIGGVLELVQYYMLLRHTDDTKTTALRYMMMGTFDNTFTLEHLAMVGIPILAGITAMMVLRGKLNLLVFGEDEARSMGMRVEFTRNLMVGIVTALTAIVISFCGMIGFVGFIVPHMTRRITGSDFRYLMPASALMGALCMTIVYHVAGIVGYTSNINVMTSVVGGAIFLAMLIRFRSGRNADWA